jgi:hypothetical protein
MRAKAGVHMQRPGCACRGRGVRAEAGMRVQGWGACADAGVCVQMPGCASRCRGARAEASTHMQGRGRECIGRGHAQRLVGACRGKGGRDRGGVLTKKKTERKHKKQERNALTHGARDAWT